MWAKNKDSIKPVILFITHVMVVIFLGYVVSSIVQEQQDGDILANSIVSSKDIGVFVSAVSVQNTFSWTNKTQVKTSKLTAVVEGYWLGVFGEDMRIIRYVDGRTALCAGTRCGDIVE